MTNIHEESAAARIALAHPAPAKSINRRVFVIGTTAALATAVPASIAAPSIASTIGEPDPIFAAIENYHRASAYYGECMKRAEEFESVLYDRAIAIADAAAPKWKGVLEALNATRDNGAARKRYCASRHNKIRYQALMGELSNTLEHKKEEQWRRRGARAETKALAALVDTIPTTIAGACALVSLVLSKEADGESFFEWSRERKGGEEEYFHQALMAQLDKFFQAQQRHAHAA